MGYVGPLGKNLHFFVSLGIAEILRFSELSVYTEIYYTEFIPISKPFHNTLNYASTANIEEVTKFYNLGYKTFETDFSYKNAGSLSKNDVFTPFPIPGGKNSQKIPSKNWRARYFVTSCRVQAAQPFTCTLGRLILALIKFCDFAIFRFNVYFNLANSWKISELEKMVRIFLWFERFPRLFQHLETKT